MSPARYDQLNNSSTEKLTEEEVKAGWHFCMDWDGLLIHKDDREYQACSCFEKGQEPWSSA